MELFKPKFTFKAEATWILAFALGPPVLVLMLAILFSLIERVFEF